MSEVCIKLRDRVLKEAKVLPNNIIDVSSFMDAYVDVDLMDECGNDLAERFISSKPNKILTIATTGLVIAIREFASCYLHFHHFFYNISFFDSTLDIRQLWLNICRCL